MIQVDAHDYVIFLDENDRPSLAKLLSIAEPVYSGILENSRHLEETTDRVEISPESVIANLGKDPINGSAYNCQIEIYQTKREYPGWGTGTVLYYRKLDKETRKLIGRAIKQARTKIEELGIDLHPFITEIKEPKGRYEGQYKKVSTRDGSVPVDILTLRPAEFDHLDYLLMHEVGHGIWFRRLTPDIQARWILAYHKAVELQNVKKEDIDQTIAEFVQSGLPCGSFRKTLDEPYSDIWDSCLEFAESKHSLSKKHLDTLIYSGYPVVDFFEVDELTISNMKLVLTEYAQKSPEEFFSEAFAFHMSGGLPKKLVKLMDLTLASAKSFVVD